VRLRARLRAQKARARSPTVRAIHKKARSSRPSRARKRKHLPSNSLILSSWPLPLRWRLCPVSLHRCRSQRPRHPYRPRSLQLRAKEPLPRRLRQQRRLHGQASVTRSPALQRLYKRTRSRALRCRRQLLDRRWLTSRPWCASYRTIKRPLPRSHQPLPHRRRRQRQARIPHRKRLHLQLRAAALPPRPRRTRSRRLRYRRVRSHA